MPCHAKTFRTKEHKKAVVGHSKDLWHLSSRSYFGVPYRSTCRRPHWGREDQNFILASSAGLRNYEI